MSTSKTVSNLKINTLTKDQFRGIDNPSDTELYFVTDENSVTYKAGEGISIDPKLQTTVSIECSNPNLEVTSSYDDTESSTGVVNYEFEYIKKTDVYSDSSFSSIRGERHYIFNGALYNLSTQIGTDTTWTYLLPLGSDNAFAINNGKLYYVNSSNQLTQIGTDDNWSSISGSYSSGIYLFGINDGKLYSIAYDLTVTLMSNDNNWTMVCGYYQEDNYMGLAINNGQLYALVDATTVERLSTDTTWTDITGSSKAGYGINNGKLYFISYSNNAFSVKQVGSDTTWTKIAKMQTLVNNSNYAINNGKLYSLSRTGVATQIGTDTNWIDVSGYSNTTESFRGLAISSSGLYYITQTVLTQIDSDSGWSSVSGVLYFGDTSAAYAVKNGNFYMIKYNYNTGCELTLVGSLNQEIGWFLNDNSVNLGDYDLTVTGTPEVGDTIDLTYTTVGVPDVYVISVNESQPPQPTDPQIYEFIINTEDSDPTAAVMYAGANANFTPASMDFTTGILDYGSWENAFFQPRPVMLKYDGTVDYELDHNDFTKKLDGSASDISNTSYGGNCMIAFPQVWMKLVEDDSTHQHVYIASEQIDNSYHCYTHQNKNGTMLDEIFINAFEPSNVSSRLRSLAGQTVLRNLSGEIMRANAQANGNLWDFMDYGELQMLQMLCVLMFKSLDTQSKIGAGVVRGSSSDYTTTGVTKDKGMFYSVCNDGSSSSARTPIKVFGIENLWGNCYKWINGLVVPKTSSTASVKYKLCDYTTDGSTSTFYTTAGTGYKTLETFSTAGEGYPNKLTLNADGLFPSLSNKSGSNTTYIPDYFYYGKNSSNDYVAVFGGNYSSGLLAGLFYLDVYYQLSISYDGIGASLSCKPL